MWDQRSGLGWRKKPNWGLRIKWPPGLSPSLLPSYVDAQKSEFRLHQTSNSKYEKLETEKLVIPWLEYAIAYNSYFISNIYLIVYFICNCIILSQSLWRPKLFIPLLKYGKKYIVHCHQVWKVGERSFSYLYRKIFYMYVIWHTRIINILYSATRYEKMHTEDICIYICIYFGYR